MIGIAPRKEAVGAPVEDGFARATAGNGEKA